MSARVRLGAYMDRASFQMGGLAGAEGLFDLRQILVAVMHFLLGSSAHREIGLDHVAAIQPSGLFVSGGVHPQRQGSPLYFDLQPVIDFQSLDPGLHRLLCRGYRSAQMLTEIAISLGNKV